MKKLNIEKLNGIIHQLNEGTLPERTKIDFFDLWLHDSSEDTQEVETLSSLWDAIAQPNAPEDLVLDFSGFNPESDIDRKESLNVLFQVLSKPGCPKGLTLNLSECNLKDTNMDILTGIANVLKSGCTPENFGIWLFDNEELP